MTGAEPGPGRASWSEADRVVDLSLTLAEDLPCSWPGAARYRHDPDHWYADVERPPPLRQWSGHPYCSFTLGLDEHTGTHFDAPTHFIPHPDSGLPNTGPAGLLGTEAIEPRQMMGNAVVIDVRELVGSGPGGVSPRIEPERLAAHEERSGTIASSDVVLFRSGWDERYRRGAAGERYILEPLVRRSEPAWPAPSPAAIEWLLRRGVRCLGTDGVSMGPRRGGRARIGGGEHDHRAAMAHHYGRGQQLAAARVTTKRRSAPGGPACLAAARERVTPVADDLGSKLPQRLGVMCVDAHAGICNGGAAGNGDPYHDVVKQPRGAGRQLEHAVAPRRAPVERAVAVATRIRPLPDSITAPPRPQIALSPRVFVTGRKAARISVRRLEHSVLNTWAIRPLARSIVTTWPS